MAGFSVSEAKLRALLISPSSSPSPSPSPASLSSASQETIALALSTTETLLHSPRFALEARDFFTLCFPPLLQRIFGFQQHRNERYPSSSQVPFSDCWLSAASHDASKSLVSLLHPSGPLFSCFSKLDQQRSPLLFFFPAERLPEWIQRALTHGHVPSSLPRIFRDRIKLDSNGSMQVQLDVFEYFFFWFAYYPLSKTADSDSALIQENGKLESANSVLKSVHKGPFSNWMVPGHRQTQKQHGTILLDPYLQLLQVYLMHFVIVSVPQSTLQVSQSEQSSETTGRADFLVNTFMGFWFSQNDSVQDSGFVLPNSRLLAAIRIFVNHINTVNCNSSTPLCSQQLQMQLFKLLHRAFLSWPATSSIKKVSEFVDVWLDYLQPWALGQGPLVEKQSVSQSSYSDRWQGFVSANYIFYTILTLHFFEFALKHMHVDPQMVLQHTAKILDVLTGLPTLLSYLKELDATAKTGAASLNQDQVQNWSHGHYYENDILLTSPQRRFFDADGNGGRQVFQMVILRAENEIVMIQDEKTYAKCSKALNSIKASGNILFSTGKPDMPPDISASLETMQSSQLFVPRSQHMWFDVKYKGDWMRRPIESTEVAWLVRSLVSLSDAINAWLDLSLDPKDKPKCTSSGILSPDPVLHPHNEVDHTMDPKPGSSTPSMLDSLLCSTKSAWLILHQYVQRRGWRVNLRFFAKKPIAVIALLIVTHFLRKAMLVISDLS